MLKPLRKALITTLGLLPMLMPVDDVRAADMSTGESNDYLTSSASELPWRKARLSLEAQTGTRNMGTLDAMLPFLGNDDFIVYADLMAKGTTDNTFEGNLGLGFRRVNDAETGIFGLYAFYDVLKSVNNNQFTQVTVGAEHLGLVWDFRANAYLPVGKTKYVKNVYSGGRADIVNNNIIQYYKTSEEQSTTGGDAEVGRIIGSQKLRAYIAAYTFGQNLTGPRARLEYQLNSHVTFNTAVQHDQARGTQYFVGARFTVGGAKATNSDSIYARLTDPVVRDVDVVTTSKVSDVTRTATDKFWMVDQTKTQSGGTGTIDNPYASIEDAINNAPEGAIIYVKGADGKIYNAGNGTKLKAGQVIIGGDQDLYFDFDRNIAHFSANSDSLFLMNGNGIRPTISGTLAANSSVGFYNLNLLANELARGDTGISVFNAKDVIIDNVSVSGFNAEDGHGLVVSGDSQVTLTNFSANNNYIGVDVLGGQVNVTDTLNIDQSQAIGLRVANGQLTANAINISNSTQYGVFASGGQITVQGDLAVQGGAAGVLAQLGSNIKANSAHLNNTNLVVDGSQIQITQDLTVSGERIAVSHGGSVQSDIANITTQDMNFNQGMWNSNHGAVSISGANEIGLWLQNASQVQFGATTISQAATSIQVDNSTLTFTDTLNADNSVALNDAILNVTNLNVGNGLTILGAKSQLNSSGAVTVAQDLTINQGSFTAKDMMLQGNVTLTAHGHANAVNALTIANADKQISLTDGGNLTAHTASVTTGTILIDNAMWNLTSSAAAVTATKNIVLQNSGVADFGAASVTSHGGLTITGADSKLISSGSVTIEQDLLIDQGGHLNGKALTFKGNVDILEGSLSASDMLTVAADKTRHFVVTPQGHVVNVDKATMSTGSVVIGGEFIVDKTLDILDTDHITITENATMMAEVANITTAGLLVNGGELISKHQTDGQLTINGTTANSFNVTNGTVKIANATINHSDLIVDSSDVLISKQLTFNDAEKVQKITVSKDSTVNTAAAMLTTDVITINGHFNADNLTIADTNSLLINSGAILSGKTADITTTLFKVDGGQLMNTDGTQLAGQLTVNGTTQDSSLYSFLLLNKAYVNIAKTTITDSSVVLNEGILETGILTVSQTAPEKGSQQVAPNYILAVSNHGRITAKDGSTVAINKVTLNGGTFENKGSLVVTGSAGDGVSLTDALSSLVVKTLTVQNSAYNGVVNKGTITVLDQLNSTNNGQNGIVMNAGTLNSHSITASNNVNSGVLVNGGKMTTSGEVTAEKNGRAPGDGNIVGHGLEMQGGNVDFKSFKGLGNFGDGVHQVNGTIKIIETTLTGNQLVNGAAGNGFVKLGGKAEIYKANINDNQAHGIYVNSDDTSAEQVFYANDITLKGNSDRGIYLERGHMDLVDVNTENQIKVGGNATYSRNLTITNMKKDYKINAGILDNAKTEKDLAALLVDSNATVEVTGAMIAGTTKGYGVWVDAGDVQLHKVTVKDNQRGIVWTNGKLTIDSESIIQNNTQYGILAGDNAQKPGTRADRILNLTNVSITGTGTATEGLVGSGYGLAVLSDSTVKLNNSAAPPYSFQISNNSEGGVYVANGDIEVIGAKIRDNHNVGVNVVGEKKSSLKITNSEISNDPQFGSSKQQTGLLLNSNQATVALQDVNLTGNVVDGVKFMTPTSITCVGKCEVSKSQNGIMVTVNNMKLANNWMIHDNQIGINAANGTINALELDKSSLINNAKGIYLSNSANVALTLKDTVIDKGAVGIFSTAPQSTITCTSNCVIQNTTQTGIVFTGATNTITGLALNSNATGISLNGQNVVLGINRTTFGNNGTAILLDGVNNGTLTFDGAASKITAGDYGVRIINSANSLAIRGLHAENVKNAAIQLKLMSPTTNFAISGASIQGGASTGVDVDWNGVVSNLTMTVDSSTLQNIPVMFNLTGADASKSGTSNLTFTNLTLNNAASAAISNRSFATLKARNVTMTGGGIGILSSGSMTSNYTLGGEIRLDMVTFDRMWLPIISNKQLVISRTSFRNGTAELQLMVTGNLYTWDYNQMEYNDRGSYIRWNWANGGGDYAYGGAVRSPGSLFNHYDGNGIAW